MQRSCLPRWKALETQSPHFASAYDRQRQRSALICSAHSAGRSASGVTVFIGTRVPIRTLFDYIEGGETLQEFLQQFPSVKREQAIAVLETAFTSITGNAAAA